MASKTSKTRPANSNANKFNSIECKPQLDWIVSSVSFGRREWFLRLQITGWCPRRFGPFETEGKALYFLDSVLNKLSESIAQADRPVQPPRTGRPRIGGPRRSRTGASSAHAQSAPSSS